MIERDAKAEMETGFIAGISVYLSCAGNQVGGD